MGSVSLDRWTQQDLETLEAEWPAPSMTGPQIAAKLGRTLCACQKKASKLKIRSCDHYETWRGGDLVESLKRLWATGISASIIAAKFGLTRNSIIGKANRLKLVSRKTVHRLAPKSYKPRKFTDMHLPVLSANVPEKLRLIPPSQPPAPPLNVPLLDAKPRQCRFIAGHDALCCGHETHGKSSWCSYHYGIVFVPRQPRRERSGGFVLPRLAGTA